MSKEDRKRRVLEFLAKTGIAAPPKVIYTNLKREGITFSENSAKRYLREMATEGFVDTLDDPRAYYFITEDGRDYLEMG